MTELPHPHRAHGSPHRTSSNPRRPRRSHHPQPFTPAQVAARRAAVPPITYPQALPVSARRDEIAAAIAANQVVIVSGETGSGKTTQIPKICLELGRGVAGMIGHTQPRRLAARTVAERLADELAVPLGQQVGYQVRFTDHVSDATLVKLMTDGILLAEIQRDPLLTRYDTIIVDEAHERSLNIDFLLGYLSNLLPRRPDLKVIITSATIDSAKFAAHFGPRMAQPRNLAPVVEVSGRTYPVDVRYRPLTGEVDDDGARGEPIDQFTAICRAFDELAAEGPGDVLVFLSGEREIRDADEALAEHLGPRYLKAGGRTDRFGAVEVVPLYARLTAAEQHRVFEPHRHRRIVLATNVAETSLTVPGIRYVIDPGTARISRYSTRTKVQRLPIEPISQASANQRSGRCGRVADGIAIRLYSQEDFDSRPAFTEPEIQRTSLASVILQMAALGLGDVARFPFVDPPDTRAIRDGLAALAEIGALGEDGALTDVGRKLARLPIDPRLGRMLLEAQRNGCATEVLIMVAAMSVQDVRERPADKQDHADQLHRRFTDPTSDFLAYLNLWRYLRARQRDLGSSAFRRMCRAEYLNYLRVREWQDVVSQLRQLAGPLRLNLAPLDLPGPGEDPLAQPKDVPADAIHRSLLVGLLSNVGAWDEVRRDYAGARGTRFVIWPGSGLARLHHKWVMTAELVETSRLFARTVAKINPDWVEPLAAGVVKKVHSEPFWSAKRGAAMIHEKVLLYGVPIVADRVVSLTSLGTAAARETAREMFLQHALVDGEWRTHHRFWRRNQELLEEARAEEDRQRQRGLVADERAIFDFYDSRIPDTVTSVRHFDSWWKDARRERPDLLDFTRDFLLPSLDAGADGSGLPDTWRQGDLTFQLEYTFAPGTRDDGVTVRIPLAVLARVRPDGFDWLVPGMLDELAVATIRALPKRTRVQLVPAPDTAARIVAHLPQWQEAVASGVSFAQAFADAARAAVGVDIPLVELEEAALPDHLRMHFAVVDAAGKVLGTSTHLLTLQRRYAQAARGAVREAVRGVVGKVRDQEAERAARGTPSAAAAPEPAGDWERQHLEAWPADLPELPAAIERKVAGGLTVRAYPTLVAAAPAGTGDVPGHLPRVGLTLLASAGEQAAAHRDGVIALALRGAALSEQRVTTRWTGAAALTLASSPYRSTTALVADLELAAARRLAGQWEETHGALATVRRAADFTEWAQFVRARLEDAVYAVAGDVVRALSAWRETQAAVKATTSLALLDVVADENAHLDRLIRPGFVAGTPAPALAALPRYLAGVRVRLERARDGKVDRAAAWQVQQAQQEVEAARAQVAAGPLDPRRQAAVAQAGWLVEELRVSLFAPTVGTPVKVSLKRIVKALDS